MLKIAIRYVIPIILYNHRLETHYYELNYYEHSAQSFSYIIKRIPECPIKGEIVVYWEVKKIKKKVFFSDILKYLPEIQLTFKGKNGKISTLIYEEV